MEKEVIKQFKALANENRLAIYEYLREYEQVSVDPEEEGSNVGDIAQQFDLALSTVSHHLRILHESGLIVCERRGQHTYCVINHQAVDGLRTFFSSEE